MNAEGLKYIGTETVLAQLLKRKLVHIPYWLWRTIQCSAPQYTEKPKMRGVEKNSISTGRNVCVIVTEEPFYTRDH